jgi:cyclic pyranopterin phosphate synthase
MESLGFWKILRVLTTNACNYKCVFCHNEGQEKYSGINNEYLKYDDFISIVTAIKKSGLREIQFSGGEPFMNPDTLEMIKWVNNNTDLEIGCATNTQYLDIGMMKELAKTRVNLHIQFPTYNKIKFQSITKTDLFDQLMINLRNLKINNVRFSLNYVLLTPNIDDFKDILPFLYENGISLKLLPYVNEKTLKYNEFEKNIIPFLNGLSYKYEDQKNGSLKWWLKAPNGETINIKYINSPCFKYEFDNCKNYGEIRITPGLELQSCLINPEGNLKIDFETTVNNHDKINDLFQKSWKNFTHC